jgi:Family of unknown function (DUF6335)
VVDPTNYMETGRDEQLDREIDVDEFDDDLESETIAITDDIPQEYTESYGTGVHAQPGFGQGGRTMRDRMAESNQSSPLLTGGDIDANWQEADAVGDEAVGGSVSTPDQSIVDELGAAVGLEMDDRAFLRTAEILEQRDDRRWELDPDSSEDYDDRKTTEDGEMES